MWSYCDTTKDPTNKAPISGELVVILQSYSDWRDARSRSRQRQKSAALSFVLLPNCRSVK